MTSAMCSSTGATQEGSTGRIKPGQRQLRMLAARPVVAFGETCLRPE